MTLFSTRFAGYVFVMLAMLAAGLSTGTRFYYLVFYALLAMLLLGFVSVLWTLLTLRVTLKGVANRVERCERIPAVFTVRHGCPLPVAAIRVHDSHVISPCSVTVSVHDQPRDQCMIAT